MSSTLLLELGWIAKTKSGIFAKIFYKGQITIKFTKFSTEFQIFYRICKNPLLIAQ